MPAGTTTFVRVRCRYLTRERAGRALMWLAALGAAASAVTALFTVLDAGGATKSSRPGACTGWLSSPACSLCWRCTRTVTEACGSSPSSASSP